RGALLRNSASSPRRSPLPSTRSTRSAAPKCRRSSTLPSCTMKASPLASSPSRKMNSPGLKLLVGISPIWRLMQDPRWYRISAVPPMVRRIAIAVTALVGLVAAWALPAAAQRTVTVQEVLLRAQPAVVLVIAEVAAEVTLSCGTGTQSVTPPVFRETGTGWVVDGRGWIITNGHVVQPAHTPPRWLVNQQAQRAVTSGTLPKSRGA